MIAPHFMATQNAKMLFKLARTKQSRVKDEERTLKATTHKSLPFRRMLTSFLQTVIRLEGSATLSIEMPTKSGRTILYFFCQQSEIALFSVYVSRITSTTVAEMMPHYSLLVRTNFTTKGQQSEVPTVYAYRSVRHKP